MIRVTVYLLLFCTLLGANLATAKNLPWLTTAQQNGHFVQKKHLTVLSKPFVTKGRYLYTQARGLDWRTESPITNHLNISVDGVVEVQLDGSHKTLTTDTRFSELLLAIFSSDEQKIEQQFAIKQTAEKLTLTPRDKQISDIFSEITVLVDKQAIQEISLFEPSGNSTQILLFAEAPLNNMEQ